jgi:hypothetical protein
MYVCDKCIEEHGLAIEQCAPTTLGPCEVCSELTGDWSHSDFLAWTRSLVRVVGLPDDVPLKEQLAKLKAANASVPPPASSPA